MTQTSRSSGTTSGPSVASGARRAYAISIGLSVLFIFFQSLSSGEFITEGLSEPAGEIWTDLHGLAAYPIMVFSLIATIVAFARLPRMLVLFTSALFVGSVAQWLLGHAITTLGWDWVTPIHVVLAFVIYGLAIYLSVRSAGLKRL